MKFELNQNDLKKFLSKCKGFNKDFKALGKKTLTLSTNAGLKYAKKNSPVITTNFREKWSLGKVRNVGPNFERDIKNSAEYASYVNYGHRILDKNGNTIGYVTSKMGDHLLEKSINTIQKIMPKIFSKELKGYKKGNDL